METEIFEEMWLERFAAGISEENLRKYVRDAGNYIWHVFSWKLLPEESFLAGERARQAYDAVSKEGAIYAAPFEAECGALPDDMKTARSAEERTEIYVAGRDFRWTYIKTHENDLCGPYFMRRTEDGDIERGSGEK